MPGYASPSFKMYVETKINIESIQMKWWHAPNDLCDLKMLTAMPIIQRQMVIHKYWIAKDVERINHALQMLYQTTAPTFL